MRKSSSSSLVKGGNDTPKKSRKPSRSKPPATTAAFLTDVNQAETVREEGPDNEKAEQEGKLEGEEEVKESSEPEKAITFEIEKKQKVVRPSTYRRVPSEDLSKKTLKLPYGLKFKDKVGVPLPKNLEEAASSVSRLEEQNPQVLNDYALDLEVLLGNKRAVSPSPTKKEEKSEELSKPAAAPAADGTGEDAATASVEAEPEPEPVVAYDLERDGPPRFGGGNTGKPLASLQEGDKGDDATKEEDKGEKVETVHDRLLGLPGALGITAGETENYFGDQSRINFFDRYHYINRQRHNSTFDPGDRSAGLAFPSHGEVFGTGVKTSDVPFAPVRPDGQGSGAALMSSTSTLGNQDVTATGMLSDTHARGASRAGRGGLFSGHNAATSTTGDPTSNSTIDMNAAATTPLGSTVGKGPNTTVLPPLPATPGLSGGGMDMGGTHQPSSIPVKINTGVEMSELFKKSATRDLSSIVEEMKSLDERAEEARALREAKIKAAMEERRLRNVTELTMEEEEAMEMEAIALQGMILDAAERERRQNEVLHAEEEEKGEEDNAPSRKSSASSSVATEMTVATPLNDAGALMTPMSPRSRYIDGCFRAGINPKASLMTRKAFSKRLDLRHHGIGDKMCLILTESILQMPYLQSLIVQDNNLTDASLGPLVQALVKMPHILEVNISNNIVGDLASNTLSDYLSSPKCSIIKLVMQSADVDDFECARFVLALQNNPSSRLQELDLTRNLLGAAEELNTVMPELVTAGEAFAELLESENCGLTKLEIAWNMVRGESAETFANAVRVNTSLTYLDLSYNAMGKSGGQRLGQALIENKTLQYLDIGSNNLDATACFSVSVGLIENTTIRRLKIDGNPIGKLGAKALMQVPLMVGRRVKLSANNCNIAISDASLLQVFDFDNLLKTYELDCSQPFERAQFYMLMYTVACHHTFILESVAHDGRALDLVPFLNPDRHQFFNDKQLQMERSLLGLIDAASDVKVAVQFFNSIDIDGSGELDRDEFKMLMDKMGIELDEDRLEEVFDTYDTDQGGTIGTDEFLVFLRRQKVDAEKRLFDLTLTPSFCLKADQAFNLQLHKDDIAARKSKLPGYTPKQRKKFEVPTSGKMVVQVEDGFKRKAIFRTVTVADKESIEEVAEGTNDTVAMNSFGVMGVKLRLDEALSLYNVMTMESRNKAKVLSKILPQLANPADARMLVQKVLKNDRTEMLTLRQTLGVAIRPLLGSMNGYYQLDLSVALDRLCLMRLLEQSTTRSMLMRRHKKAPLAGVRAIDLSQRKMANSSFRNETYNGRPIHIDTAFATPLPRMGLLSFDFSGGNLPSIDDMICSDQRVVKILVTLHMMHSSPDAMDCAVRKLERLKKASERSMGGNGLTIYESSWERSIEVGEAMDSFYENLADRPNELEEVKDQEDIPVNVLAPAQLQEIEGVTDEELTAKVLGHHFDLDVDANTGPGSLDRKEQRARAKKAAAAGDGGDDGSQTSLSLSHAGSHHDTMSLGTYEGGSIATLSQEESTSVVMKANQLGLHDDEEEDEGEDQGEANEEDEYLYVVITSIDTRGIAVGTSVFGAPAPASETQKGEEEEEEGKEGAREKQEPPPRFPYMQIVLGDQRARSYSFAQDQESVEREAHLREPQRENHHHKHGRGHHGKKAKKKKAEEEAAAEEEEQHDDLPVYPLRYNSPNFVCVKTDDAYELETEAMKKMVNRRREEMTAQWEEKKKKREKEAKKGKGKDKHVKHQETPPLPKEDQSAAAHIHAPKKSIREFGDEDSEEEGQEGAREAGETAEGEGEEAPENLSQHVTNTPSEEPIPLRFDPGPQGTTQVMLMLMDTFLLPAEGSVGDAEAAVEQAQEHESKHPHEPHISPRDLFEPPAPSAEAPTMSGDPCPLAKVVVDLGSYMAPLMAGEEVDLPWQKLDITVASASTKGKGVEGGDDDSVAEKEREESEGVKLAVKMMRGKELREWSANLTERRQKRHDVLLYEALSPAEKEKLRKEEEQMIKDSGLGGKKAEKIRLVGDEGEDDEDQAPRGEEGEDVHKDGRNINTRDTHAREPWAIKFRATILHDQVSKRAKALRVLEALDDSFSKLWLLCRHLALIVEAFEHMGKLHRTAYFGSYRSDLVCQLYERLVDIRNFDLVLRVLHPHEVAAVKCRLGWLNFFNPLKPEGAFQLNLSRYEERMLAKFMCTLATTEPGNNWTQFQFRHRADKDLVPGWELTDGWVKQDGKDTGINPRGILTLFYYSGDGQRLQGCRPNINFRKALLNLCFLSETDFRPEEDFSEPLSAEDRKKHYEKGVKYAASNQGLFMNYLYCDKQTYAHVIPPKRGDNDDLDEESGED